MQILMCLMSLSLSVAAGITVCQEPRIKNNLKFDDSAFTLNLQGFDRKYKEFPQPIEEKLNIHTCKEKNLIQ